MTQFYGLGAAGPDHAGAFAPGYGTWLAERLEADRHRTPETRARDRRYHMILATAREIEVLIRHLRWYIEASPGWYLTGRIEPTRAELLERMRRHAVLVAGGDPDAALA